MDEEIKDIIEILELSKNEIENNENITATLDLQDLKSLKKLYDLYKKQQKEIEEYKEMENCTYEILDKSNFINKRYIRRDKVEETIKRYYIHKEKILNKISELNKSDSLEDDIAIPYLKNILEE